MTLAEVREKLKDYKAPDFSATITRIDYSGDDDFVLGDISFGMGDAPVPVTSKVLKELGVRTFFRVDVTLSAGPGSNVHGEILFPEKDWNEKVVYTANGGPGQTLMQHYELACLYDPYVSMNSDLGTSDIDTGLVHPAAVIDAGWRAEHMTVVVGKEMAEILYGKPVKHAYCTGASSGGQQSIAAATYCPDDFDGIISFCPGISRTHLHSYFVWSKQQLVRDDGTPKFDIEEDAKKLNKIILDYHKRHGYGAPGDPFVSVPFTQQEREEILDEIENSGEFSEEQMKALRAFYQGPVNPETGEKIFSGFAMGGEINPPFGFGFSAHFDHAGNFWIPAWGTATPFQEFLDSGYRKFDFAKDVDSYVMKRLEADMNADSGDLDAFRARGGKMILLNGVIDEYCSVDNFTDYYERVVEKQGGLESTKEFCRYFIVPGFGHAVAPEGGFNWFSGVEDLEDILHYFAQYACTQNDALLRTLDRWVCDGVAPDSLMATACNRITKSLIPDITSGIKRQRPVYAYPDSTEYIGGDPDLPTSFQKKAGKLGDYVRPRTGHYVPK